MKSKKSKKAIKIAEMRRKRRVAEMRRAVDQYRPLAESVLCFGRRVRTLEQEVLRKQNKGLLCDRRGAVFNYFARKPMTAMPLI